MPDDSLLARVLALDPAVRYVAVAHGQDVAVAQRDDLVDASSVESDRYEELLVNPTLLTLARQRGDIDCGGLRHLLVRYGHFWQVVLPLPDGGHVSVAVEPDADAAVLAERVRALVLGAPPATA